MRPKKSKKPKYPGWLSCRAAATAYGVGYEALLRLAREGVFTVGRFTCGARKQHRYLRPEEVAAWKSGGIEAVAALRAKAGAQ